MGEPPQTEPPQTEPPQTEPPQTEPPQLPEGEITSPNYPQNYNNSLDWTEVVSASSSDNRIWIVFDDFCLENDQLSPDTLQSTTDCPHDWVTITETSSEKTLLEKRCGCEEFPIPMPLVSRHSRTDSVTVHFHSDSADTNRGFKFRWYAVEESADRPTTTPPTTTPEPEPTRVILQTAQTVSIETTTPPPGKY